MLIDRLARGPWELGIGWQASRTAHSLHSSDGALAKLSPLSTTCAPSDR